MRRPIITTVLILSLITIGTVFAILYAKGYRLVPEAGRARIAGTGILVVTSKPEGARVYINDHLTTATNNTINLSPGEYSVRIEKDGYFPWQKKVGIKKEIVREADATLFPIAPKLEAATLTGVKNPAKDPSGTLIAFTSTSSTPAKSGIFILDMNSRPLLALGGNITQIADNNTADLSEATLSFSPDGTQLVASVSGTLGNTTYLLSVKGGSVPQDVSATLPQLQAEWERLSQERNKKVMDSKPKKVRALFSEFFKNPLLSPDGDKVVYAASKSAELPIVLSPRWTSINSATEERNLKQGNTYVYDIKEDRNYLLSASPTTPTSLTSTTPNFIWHPDDHHLFYIKDKAIHVIEYDGNNDTTVYAGPFVDSFLFPWPDGSSIVVLTNLNIPDVPNNLYRISLK